MVLAVIPLFVENSRNGKNLAVKAKPKINSNHTVFRLIYNHPQTVEPQPLDEMDQVVEGKTDEVENVRRLQFRFLGVRRPGPIHNNRFAY